MDPLSLHDLIHIYQMESDKSNKYDEVGVIIKCIDFKVYTGQMETLCTISFRFPEKRGVS